MSLFESTGKWEDALDIKYHVLIFDTKQMIDSFRVHFFLAMSTGNRYHDVVRNSTVCLNKVDITTQN